MSAAVAERTVVKLNPRGYEADPIFEVELYDPETGERLPKEWERRRCHGRDHDEFTLPAPEVRCIGLRPEFADARPGRYVVPGQLEGRVW